MSFVWNASDSCLRVVSLQEQTASASNGKAGQEGYFVLPSKGTGQAQVRLEAHVVLEVLLCLLFVDVSIIPIIVYSCPSIIASGQRLAFQEKRQPDVVNYNTGWSMHQFVIGC